MAKKKSQTIGRWRISSITEWDQDFVDEEVPGYFEFTRDSLGEFHFGYVQCSIDWRNTERDGQPAIEFTFDGMDEMTPASGRGWAIINGDTLDGRIFFHQGDESGFKAAKVKQ